MDRILGFPASPVKKRLERAGRVGEPLDEGPPWPPFQPATLASLPEPVHAVADALEPGMLAADASSQAPVNGFLGYRTLQQTLNCQMDVCGTHRAMDRHQHLDDGARDLAIAEPCRWCRYRLRRRVRLDRLVGQSLEHGHQGRRRVCKPS